jgi:hypothetical protein
MEWVKMDIKKKTSGSGATYFNTAMNISLPHNSKDFLTV